VIGHVRYTFPLPAHVAVCAFEKQFADGHVITGLSKEKTQTALEYKKAIMIAVGFLFIHT
jgi:hypothetical protein